MKTNRQLIIEILIGLLVAAILAYVFFGLPPGDPEELKAAIFLMAS